MRRDWREVVILAVLPALLVVAVVSGAAALKAFSVAGDAKHAARTANLALEQLAREGVARRDDSCRKDEREHLGKVEQLRRTYEYLKHLTARERQASFNRAIIQFLPQTEAAARNDVAPDYCDEPGEKAETLWYRTKGERGKPPVGLREPDPVVPERPDVLK